LLSFYSLKLPLLDIVAYFIIFIGEDHFFVSVSRYIISLSLYFIFFSILAHFLSEKISPFDPFGLVNYFSNS